MRTKVAVYLHPSVNLGRLKEGDILMYNKDLNCFYVVTPEKFFEKYELKLTELLAKYDEVVKRLEKGNLVQQNDNESYQSKMNQDFQNFKSDILRNNVKLIEMVESFIKGGKE